MLPGSSGCAKARSAHLRAAKSKWSGSSHGKRNGSETPPDDIDALRAALLAEHTARREAEARATGAEALIRVIRS